MAKVNPFIAPIPQKFMADPELRGYFEYLTQFLHDLLQRTGGGNDDIADLELTVVSQDGGNRTYRFLEDEIQDLKASIAELKRKNQRLIDELQLSQEPIKRNTRTLEQKINELEERIDSGT